MPLDINNRIITSLHNRIEELETFIHQHIGNQAGRSGDQYPHPDLKVSTLFFGDQNYLNNEMIQFITQANSTAWVNFFADPRLGYDPRGDLEGYNNGTLGLYRLVAYSKADNTKQGRVLASYSTLNLANAKIEAARGSTVATVQVVMDTAALTGYAALQADQIKLQGWIELTPLSATISVGVITIIGNGVGALTVDTEGGTATDDLDTITSSVVTDGSILLLRTANSARDVVVKHNTGNILLNGSADFTLDDTSARLLLVWNGTKWIEIARSNSKGTNGESRARMRFYGGDF